MTEEKKHNRTYTIDDMKAAFVHGLEYEEIIFDGDMPDDIQEKNMSFYEWLERYNSK
jgi:hypothetical protein